jgi:lysophospholipase L1-like esterase
VNVLFFLIKIFIAKVLNLFNFYVNYPGLRFETIKIKKNYKKTTLGKTILCIGDSNTFGWNNRYQQSYPFLLENSLKSQGAEAKVINCGISGDTISDGIKRLEQDVLFFKPDFVIINFGPNDARLFKIKRNNKIKIKSNSIYLLNNDFYSMKTNIENFQIIFEKIIRILQESNIKIILTGLYKVNKIKTGIFYKSEKELVTVQNKVFEKYNNCIKDVALNSNVLFFDLWNNLNNCEKIKNCLQDDGFHIGTEGYKLIAENLSGTIGKNCFLK